MITSGKLARGQSSSVYQTEQDKEVFLSIKFDVYDWSKRVLVTNAANASDSELTIADPATKHLLHVHLHNEMDVHGTRQISLFTACWLLNKVPLHLPFSVTLHLL